MQRIIFLRCHLVYYRQIKQRYQGSCARQMFVDFVIYKKNAAKINFGSVSFYMSDINPLLQEPFDGLKVLGHTFRPRQF